MSLYSFNLMVVVQLVVIVCCFWWCIGIFVLLVIGIMINYFDCIVLGIVVLKFIVELGIDLVIMGIFFFVFVWIYVLVQIFGGLFFDCFGNKVIYFLLLILWLLFILFYGMVVGLKILLLCCFGFGISEVLCFLVNSWVVSVWFLQQEWVKVMVVYIVGEYFGLVCFVLLLFWIMDGFGWWVLFVSVGVVGILFVLVWWCCYCELYEDLCFSQQECEYIENGGGFSVLIDQQVVFSWLLVCQLLSKWQIIGVSIGQFVGNIVLVFFFIWFFIWLVIEWYMFWLKVGFFFILLFVVVVGGVMFGGWFFDKLLKVIGLVNFGCKLLIVVGLLMVSCIIIVNWLESDLVVILVMLFVFFGQGMVGFGWMLIFDIVLKGLGGLIGGLFNFCVNFVGIFILLVIGFIVVGFGNFFYVLIYIGGVVLLGVVVYLFIFGDVKCIELLQ